MQIIGKGKICNKWVNGQLDKNQFDFENRGSIAFGKFQWTDVKKGKNGTKDEFTTTIKRFAAFDSGVIDLLENSFGQMIEIEGKLEGSSYIDKGSKKSQEQIIINKASFAEKKVDQHSKAKGDAYQPQAEEGDDEILF